MRFECPQSPTQRTALTMKRPLHSVPRVDPYPTCVTLRGDVALFTMPKVCHRYDVIHVSHQFPGMRESSGNSGLQIRRPIRVKTRSRCGLRHRLPRKNDRNSPRTRSGCLGLGFHAAEETIFRSAGGLFALELARSEFLRLVVDPSLIVAGVS